MGAAVVLGNGDQLAFQAPALILLCLGAIAIWSTSFKQAQSWCWLDVITVLTAGYFLIRAHLSPVPEFALQDQALVIGALAFYWILVFGADSKAFLRLESVIFWLAWVGCALGVYQSLKAPQFHILAFLGYERTEGATERPSGFYNYYGHFGNFLLIASVLSLRRLLNKTSGFDWWSLFRTLVFVGMLGWTGSRGSFLALGVAGVVFGVLLLISPGSPVRGKRFWIWLGAGTALVLVAGSLFYLGFGERVAGERATAEDLLDGGTRPFMRAIAWKQAAENPLMGTGSRSFDYYFDRFFNSVSVKSHGGTQDAVYTHNEFFQVLAEYGWMGVIALVSVFGGHFSLAAKGLFQVSGSWEERSWLVAGAAGLAGTLAQAWVDFHLHVLPNLLLAVFFLAAIRGFGRGADLRSNSADWGWHGKMASGLALLFLCVWCCLQLLYSACAGVHLFFASQEEGPDANQRLERLLRANAAFPSYKTAGAIAEIYRQQALELSLTERVNLLNHAEGFSALASALHPADIRTLMLRAKILDHLGRKEDSVKVWDRAMVWGEERRLYRVQEHFCDFLGRWAADAFVEGNWDKARQLARRAVELMVFVPQNRKKPEQQNPRRWDSRYRAMMTILDSPEVRR
ncbi:MAG: O-antigen ligase family protein [Verrucomicrobiota bacterium]